MAAADDTYLDEAYDEGIDHAHAGEIVQWYAKRPVTVSTAAASAPIMRAGIGSRRARIPVDLRIQKISRTLGAPEIGRAHV